MSQLLSLPAELRETIWHLVYQPSHNWDDAAVDISKAEPPTRALLLTCKQTHTEAAPFYPEALRNYWEHSHFVYKPEDSDSLDTNRAMLQRHGDAMSHIKNIKVMASAPVRHYSLIHPKGAGWSVTHYPSPLSDPSAIVETTQFIRLRVSFWREKLDPAWDDNGRWRGRYIDHTDHVAWDAAVDEEGLVATCEGIANRLSLTEQILLVHTAARTPLPP